MFLKKQEELVDTSPIAVDDASPVVADDASLDIFKMVLWIRNSFLTPFWPKTRKKKNTLEAVINLSIASKNKKKSSQNLK